VFRGVYTAATGMVFQMKQVDLIANNLANVETNGFKRKELLGTTFGDLVVQFAHQAPGTDSTVGTGVKVDGVARFETPGNLVQTGNPFNLALAGPGYFLVRSPDGTEKLTRDGDFQLDNLNRLVTRAGDLVLDTGRRPIVLDGESRSLRVAENGQISLGDQFLGNVLVVNPPAEALETRFPLAPPGLAPVLDGVNLRQGFLEHSNVNVVTEMVSLLGANRIYGFGQKIITAQDQMLQKAANDLGRTS
jgi:flagellar basal body rod protein FlgG